MGEPEELEEQGLEILEALAKIEAAYTFRLRDFMRELGMNETQPVIFYRQLIKEAHEIMSFLDLLQQSIDIDANAIAQLKANLFSKDEQVNTLTAKLRRLENEAHHKTDSLKKERNGLEVTASQLQEKAESYEGIKELLKGRMDTKAVGALYRLFSDMNMEMLYADLEGRPPLNPDRLDSVRQKLRDDLLEVLEIPKDTLEEENKKLKEQIDAIVTMIKRVYGGGGYKAP